METLQTSPYGRSVYKCDNGVVDNQSVIMEFENRKSADFSMTGFTPFRRHASLSENTTLFHAYSGHPFGERVDFNNEGKVCAYRYHIVDPYHSPRTSA